jgi:hypothetical protein
MSKPALMCGHETLLRPNVRWVKYVKRGNSESLSGLETEQGVWRIIRIQETSELHKSIYLTSDIKARPLNSLGHVI